MFKEDGFLVQRFIFKKSIVNFLLNKVLLFLSKNFKPILNPKIGEILFSGI